MTRRGELDLMVQKYWPDIPHLDLRNFADPLPRLYFNGA